MTESPGTRPWLTVLDTCPSTNSWTLEHQDSCEHGQCVFTRHQTAGKGQRGRTWISDPGVLTATFAISLQNPSWAGLLPIATGLAVCETCQEFCPATQFDLKWPNDVWADHRKLAGILCEGRLQADGTVFIAVGIGLNVSPSWDDKEISRYCQETGSITPIALSNLLPDPPKPENLLAPIRERLLHHVQNLSPDRRQSILTAFENKNILKNQTITVTDIPGTTDTLCGLVQGIDAEGRLLVRTSDDTIVTISAGRVRLAVPNGKERC